MSLTMTCGTSLGRIAGDVQMQADRREGGDAILSAGTPGWELSRRREAFQSATTCARMATVRRGRSLNGQSKVFSIIRSDHRLNRQPLAKVESQFCMTLPIGGSCGNSSASDNVGLQTRIAHFYGIDDEKS
jgi:hypothetical protein